MSDSLNAKQVAPAKNAEKRNRSLPRDISGALKNEGLKPGVRIFSLTDLGLDDNLSRGVVLLTDEELWIVELEYEGYADFGSASPTQSTGFFQRNRDKTKQATIQALEPGKVKHLQKYAIDQISDAKMENEVIGGKLVLTVDDEDYIVARFSGSLFKEMNLFVPPPPPYREELKVLSDSSLTETERKEQVEKLRTDRTQAADDALAAEEEGMCPTCGRRYPEEGRAFCPHCLPRESVFGRLLNLFSPYKRALR